MTRLERSEAPEWMGLHLFMFISGMRVECSTVQYRSIQSEQATFLSSRRTITMSITALPPTTTPVFERISPLKKAEVVQELSALLGTKYVLHTPYDLMLYEYDASIDRCTPDIVVMPASTAEVAAIVKIAARHNVPVVPRGAGTGLSGGAIPI